jgi:glycerophosphoryl diester phosphodiesterase
LPLAGVETDCCLTRDGALVLLHDTFLPKSLGIDGWAGSHTATELTSAPLLTSEGERSNQFPLLIEDVLDDPRLADKLLQLEVKSFCDPDLAMRTAAAVGRAVDAAQRPNETTEIISFWPEACEVAAAAGFMTRLIVAAPYAPDKFAAWAKAGGIGGAILEAHYWSWRVVDTWRDAGLSVMSGVVNEPELAMYLLRFNPDALATDAPHELGAALHAAVA